MIECTIDCLINRIFINDSAAVRMLYFALKNSGRFWENDKLVESLDRVILHFTTALYVPFPLIF